jgi:hypothetical protein
LFSQAAAWRAKAFHYRRCDVGIQKRKQLESFSVGGLLSAAASRKSPSPDNDRELIKSRRLRTSRGSQQVKSIPIVTHLVLMRPRESIHINNTITSQQNNDEQMSAYAFCGSSTKSSIIMPLDSMLTEASSSLPQTLFSRFQYTQYSHTKFT